MSETSCICENGFVWKTNPFGIVIATACPQCSVRPGVFSAGTLEDGESVPVPDVEVGE